MDRSELSNVGTVLQDLWAQAQMPSEALNRVAFQGEAQGFASSFAVDMLAPSAIAAAALAATEIDLLRTAGSPAQGVTVNVAHALAETTGYFNARADEALAANLLYGVSAALFIGTVISAVIDLSAEEPEWVARALRGEVATW